MTKDALTRFIGHWLPKVEDEMRTVLHNDEKAVAKHYGMMQYHLGWMNEQLHPHISPAGKRLRPMLCLLACEEMGGDTANALPAAAAIELLHNFSLIHDDVEDGDEVRRHRLTVWRVWGIPQAINAGDAMFTLAFAAIQRLNRRGVDAATTLRVLDIFTQTSLALTEGQHLDIDFEQRPHVTTDEYIRMIQGKTAALVGASVAIGATIAHASAEKQAILQTFGRTAGLAFQIQDDILGIWGDPSVTGKAAGNDVLRRKKSLPILHALAHEQVGEELQALFAGELNESHLPHAMALFERAETRSFAETMLHDYHEQAIDALAQVLGSVNDSVLYALTDSLLHRKA